MKEIEHRYQDLISIFNHCFYLDYNTQLVKGGDEPIYLPADASRHYHAIFFAHGFYSSGMHECAHWLIAGEERRKLVDFGYWYEPDGRTPAQQLLFQTVEVKPQAIESILCEAAGFRFQVSIDNLNGGESNTDEFKEAIAQQIVVYKKMGLPKRAERFKNALCAFYGVVDPCVVSS